MAKIPHRGVGTRFTPTEMDSVLVLHMWLIVKTGVKLCSALCMSVQQKPLNLHLISLLLHAPLLWASVLMRVTLDWLSAETLNCGYSDMNINIQVY